MYAYIGNASTNKQISYIHCALENVSILAVIFITKYFERKTRFRDFSWNIDFEGFQLQKVWFDVCYSSCYLNYYSSIYLFQNMFKLWSYVYIFLK